MTTPDLTTDGHVHTHHCNHASGTMEQYVRAALAKGFRRLIFLEHFECGIDYFESTWLSPDDFNHYIATGERLKREYAGRLEVGIGVEVGYNPERLAEISSFLQSYPWERIGLSYHFMRQGDRHLNMLSRKQANMQEFSRLGVDQVVGRYLDGLLVAVAAIDAQVLCHLDAVLRHHPDLRFTISHQDQIVALLERVAEKGMALEINTSGFAHRGEAYPADWIREKATALGIAFVVGSDAHRPQDVGRNFERLRL